MASPVMTFNALGNIASSQALAAGATSVLYSIDASTDFELQMQVDILAGAAVAATNGVTVNVYRVLGSGTLDTDTIPAVAFTITPLTASAHSVKTVALSTGKYEISLTNTDATNAVTYTVTSAAVTSIA